MAHLTLLGQLLRRDIQERYHGTALGMAWLLLQPLALLLVYTLVFGEILQVRQGIAHEKVSHFAFYLLAGLGMFNALADVLVRAPLLLTEKRDWLLHSSLPAYLLPLVPVGTSILLESLLVGLLLLGMLFTGQVYWQSLLFYPPFLVARVLLSSALAYLLAVLGVFLRDLRQIIAPLLTVLLLISPILYPPEQIPAHLQAWLAWNPLLYLVEGYRAALLEGVFKADYCLALCLVAGLGLGMALWLFQSLLPRARYVL